MIHASLATVYQSLVKTDTLDVKQSSRFSFVVLPWHLDLNLHLNNAYYFKFCNQARFVFLAKYKVFYVLLKERLVPVITKTEIRYFRSLKLADAFHIETSISEIKPQNIIMQQIFYRGSQKIAELESTVKLIRKG